MIFFSLLQYYLPKNDVSGSYTLYLFTNGVSEWMTSCLSVDIMIILQLESEHVAFVLAILQY